MTQRNRARRVLRLGKPFFGHIGRPEGLRDDDVGIGQFPLERGIRAVLVRGDNKLVTGRFEIFSQTELARHAAEQRPGLEVDGRWCRQGLAVRIALDLRQIIPRIFLRITAGRIVVENAKDLHRQCLSSPESRTRAKRPGGSVAYKRQSMLVPYIALTWVPGPVTIGPWGPATSP